MLSQHPQAHSLDASVRRIVDARSESEDGIETEKGLDSGGNDAGGGTRTPDTRIIILPLRLRLVAAGGCTARAVRIRACSARGGLRLVVDGALPIRCPPERLDANGIGCPYSDSPAASRASRGSRYDLLSLIHI